MKRLVVFAALASALALHAADKSIGYLQLAGKDGFEKAAARFVSMTGNPMLGMALAPLANVQPYQELFGAARKGFGAAFVIDGFDSELKPRFAVLYPVSGGKAKFLAGNDGAVETNGAVMVQHDGDPWYVVFSKDGQWAAASDRKERLNSAFEFVPQLSKPMKDELLRFEGELAPIVKVMAAALDSTNVTEKVKDAKQLKSMREQFKVFSQLSEGIAKVRGKVRLGDAGLDFIVKADTLKGSFADSLGRIPLAKDALAFAGKRGFVASAAAEGAAFTVPTAAESWGKVVDILARHGIRQSVLTLSSKNGADTLTFDPAELKKVIGDKDLRKRFEKLIDGNDFGEELTAAFSENGYRLEPSKAMKSDFEVAGHENSYAASELFKNTFSDFSKHHPKAALTSVGVFPFYGTVYHGYSVFAECTSDKAKAQEAKELLEMLPPVPKCAAGSICWRDGSEYGICIRIPTDEFKALGTAAGVFMAAQSMSAMSEAAEADADE